MLKKMTYGAVAAAGLTVLSLAVPSTSAAYSIKIINSDVSVTVSARAGSNEKGPDTNSTRQVTNNSTQVTFVGSSLSAEISSSFALGLAYAIPFPRLLRTAIVLDLRSVATGSLTGEANVMVAGVINLSFEKSSQNESPFAGILLESSLEKEPGTSGYFRMEDVTSGTTLFNSDVQGYPASRVLAAQVGHDVRVSFGGSGQVFSLAGDSGGSTLHQRASLEFTTAVPEPGTGILAALGLAALGLFGRSRTLDA